MGDVTKILRDLDIPVYHDDGSCRSLRDILEDLNDLWENLTACQRQYIYDISKGDNHNEK